MKVRHLHRLPALRFIVFCNLLYVHVQAIPTYRVYRFCLNPICDDTMTLLGEGGSDRKTHCKKIVDNYSRSMTFYDVVLTPLCQ